MLVQFAERINNIKTSEIRDILKLTQKPEMISFAGGLPAPELFPIEEIKEIAVKVLNEDGRQALQYDATEGYGLLRKQIAERMNNVFKTAITSDDVLVTSGSQQGLDFSGKLFLDPGDYVLCESPTYLGAINAFNSYSPRYIEVPTDENGMIMDELKKILATTEKIKLIYVNPDYQNPTGRTWSLERRKEFMNLITKYEIPVVEDNPYGELNFSEEIKPSLKSLDEKGLVIFLGTFSKIFCPGFRIGWVVADNPILAKYILIKQGADLHTSSISQREIARYIEIYDLDAHIEKIKKVYKQRRNLIIKTMEQEFPRQVNFSYPQGGLFTWVELPTEVDAKQVLIKSLAENVAFVPGGSFYPNGGKENFFRLNYSNMSETKIVTGIKRLGKVLKEFINVR